MNSNNLNDCPDILREFLFYMETIRGRSAKTVDAYYIDLRTYFRYLKMQKVLGVPPKNNETFQTMSIADLDPNIVCSITLNDVYGFLHFALSELKNGSASRSRKVSSIRSFYKYLSTKTPYLEENPVRNLEVPGIKRAMPRYLTLEESLELLQHIQTSSSARDYCIITFFLNCGMRVSELVGINLTDIRENTLRLLGKGNKERIVYLNEACLSALEQYLTRERKQPEKGTDEERNALFLSSRGKRLTSRRVEQIVEQCLKLAGLDGRGISPHKLRHTAATLMYQHGNVDIRVLKEILGHANLGTTEIYTHVSNQQIEGAVDRSPLSHVRAPKKEAVPSAKDLPPELPAAGQPTSSNEDEKPEVQ